MFREGLQVTRGLDPPFSITFGKGIVALGTLYLSNFMSAADFCFALP